MATDLFTLQNLVKRDPEGYKQEFAQQHKHFLTQLEIFQLKPSKDHYEFSALIKFLSAVAPSFSEELNEFPTQLSTLLEQNATVLSPELRMVLVRALILLRNRNLLSPTSLLSLFFKLFSVPDKPLRILLRGHIIADITRCNKRKQNRTLNTNLQNFMYTIMLQDAPSGGATPSGRGEKKKKATNHSIYVGQREALLVMIELFRKKIWKDKKTVQVISQGIFSEDSKMKWITINFFLKKNPKRGATDDDDDGTPKKKKLATKKQIEQQFNSKVSKKTRAKKRLYEKKLQELDRDRKQQVEDEVNEVNIYNAEAMDLVPDPQGYAEKVFAVLKRSNHAFEVKVAMMNLVSRFITHCKLIVPSFYSFMQKYTMPHQQHITQLLAILAQSVHPLVPPDTIVRPLVMHVANNFVTDRRPVQVIAIGLNTIREMCMRSPLVMDKTLLKDLIAYKTHKDRGVMMASRSLIGLFRAINPKILPAKERGRDTDMTVIPQAYGEEEVMEGIEGTEYLDKYQSGELDLSEIGGSAEESGSGSDDESEDEWEEVDDDTETTTQGDDSMASRSEVDSEATSNLGDDDDEEGDEDEDGEEAGEGDSDDDEGKEGKEGEEGEGLSIGEGMESYDSEEDSDDEGEEGGEGKKPKAQKGDKGEDGEEAPQLIPITPALPRLEVTKILSQEEWEKLRKIQEKLSAKNPNKRRRQDEIEPIIEEGTLEPEQKKFRATYEERVAAKLELQDDNSEFRKFGRRRKAASTSNVGKKKTKNFVMMRQKALGKQRRTVVEKQKLKSSHIQKQKYQKMNKKF